MYSGMLINDLFAAVERAETFARLRQLRNPDSRTSRAEAQAPACHCSRKSSEPEQFPQPFRLSPANWNLGLLLVVEPQLIRALEPGNDFFDPIDIHQE